MTGSKKSWNICHEATLSYTFNEEINDAHAARSFENHAGLRAALLQINLIEAHFLFTYHVAGTALVSKAEAIFPAFCHP